MGVAVHVRATAEHGRDGQGSDRERGRRPRRRCLPSADHRRGQSTADGRGGEQRTRCVGELRRLAILQTCDPGDPGDPCDQPGADGGGVDRDDGEGDQPGRSGPGDEACADLGDRAEDEQAGHLWVLGVDSGGSGMDHAGADGRHDRDRQPRHAGGR